MKRLKSWSGIVLLAVLATTIAAVLAGTYTVSQQVPEFYSQALSVKKEVQTKASREMGSRVSMLYNEVRRAGRWDALFTAEQINGWLAVDLEQNHKEVLAENVHEPRVQISSDSITLAARIDGDTLSTVFTLTVEPYLYRPNVVAFRVRKARAGLLPIPMNDVLREVSTAMENLGLPLSWIQVEGDPVALVTIIPQPDQEENVRWLDQLEIHDGEIYVAGRTLPSDGIIGAPDSEAARPLARLAMLPSGQNEGPPPADEPRMPAPAPLDAPDDEPLPSSDSKEDAAPRTLPDLNADARPIEPQPDEALEKIEPPAAEFPVAVQPAGHDSADAAR